MKKQLSILSIIFLMAVYALALSACADNTPPPNPTTYTVLYSANIGGSITGEKAQTVLSGANASTVTATANSGYVFDQWSDGVKTAERTDKNVSENITVTASFREKPQTFTLVYGAGEHGTIEGPLTQILESGQAAEAVTAVADEWYEFVGWSDGYPNPRRWDGFASKDIEATASFKRIETTLKLNYESGSADNNITQLTFHIDNFEDVTSTALPLPTKERFQFEGWFLRYKPLHNDYFSEWFAGNEERVTDGNGQFVISNEIINADAGIQEIYAKWTATETQTYKILVVFITRVEARLPNIYKNRYINVDYTMSADERKFCEAATKQLKRAMNGMMDGLVEFQIDEYYTTQTVVTEDFHQPGGATMLNNKIVPEQLPEVRSMLKDYGSVLTIYSLDCYSLDANDDLHSASGSALARYGEAYLDNFLQGIYLNNISIEDMLSDLSHHYWDKWLKPPIHELAHTIEMRINSYNYHESCENMEIDGELLNTISGNKLYYLHEIDTAGEKVGIPYGFWKGEIATVRYESTSNLGYIHGSKRYRATSSNGVYYEVLYGFDTPSVTAKPFPGYRFTSWSDGVTSATRTDRNVTGNLTFTANFEPIDYTINFISQAGGKVEGDTYAILQRNLGSAHVKAVADDGYEFVGWSDGNTDVNRIFYITVHNAVLFDENDSLTITAIFKKIE